MKYINFFYSVKGIIPLFILLLFINWAILKINIRLDVTQDKLYSLSEGTTKILDKLDKDITLKLFFSKNYKAAPFFLKNYVKRVTDLLTEYQKAGKGKIKFEIYDPVIDSQEEEMALDYGMQNIDIAFGETIYFGLAAVCEDKIKAIPFIDPLKEERLEYEVTEIIANLSERAEKKKIGIISGLNIFGVSSSTFNPEALTDNLKWYFIEELENSYEVIKINPNTEAFDNDMDLLIIINPKNLNEKLQYKIDRHILSGKNALIFVDPLCIAEASSKGFTDSSFDKFFSAWKIGMKANEILADFNFSTQLTDKNGLITENPYFISPEQDAFNKQSVIVSGLETMLFPFAGALFKEKDCPYDFEPLIVSSSNSNLDANFTSHFDLNKIRSKFVPSKKQYNIAVKISGKFNAAFPNIKSGESSLKKGIDNSTVIIVADADMLYDDYYIDKGNFLGIDTSEIFNDNLNFLLNTTEALTGSDLLISVRTIGRFERPFTKAFEIEDKARQKWFLEEQKLIEKAEELEAKISSFDENNFYDMQDKIIDKDSNAIKEFEKERTAVEKRLKEVRKKFREDIEKLAAKIKFFNIVFIPLCIIIAGCIFGIYRKKKSDL